MQWMELSTQRDFCDSWSQFHPWKWPIFRSSLSDPMCTELCWGLVMDLIKHLLNIFVYSQLDCIWNMWSITERNNKLLYNQIQVLFVQAVIVKELGFIIIMYNRFLAATSRQMWGIYNTCELRAFLYGYRMFCRANQSTRTHREVGRKMRHHPRCTQTRSELAGFVNCCTSVGKIWSLFEYISANGKIQ